MKYIRYAFYLIAGLLLLSLALNNQDVVNLTILPEFVPGLPTMVYTVPLFIVILGAMLIGTIIGYVSEYLRETRIRRSASKSQKALKKTTAELEALKKEAGKHDDDVLAILE